MDGVSSAQGSHQFAARPGHHLAPQMLSSGKNVFEELGTGFTLLALDAEDSAVDAFAQVAKALKISLHIIRDSYADGREKYEAPLVLIRPDQFVAWVGQESPEDATDILRIASGR